MRGERCHCAEPLPQFGPKFVGADEIVGMLKGRN